MLEREPHRIHGALALLVAGLAGCEGGGGEASGAPGSGLPDASASAPAASAPAPRRPSRRYYLARTKERCEVYSVEADVIAPIEVVPCPPSIEVGERIRLAGRTCMREGSPEREQPVVCPEILGSSEAEDRAENRAENPAENPAKPK